MEQVKFPANIGTSSTKYRCISFLIFSTNDDAKSALTNQDYSALSSDASTSTSVYNGDLKSSVAGISLPLPNNLEDSQAHSWERQEGALTAGASILDTAASKAKDKIDSLTKGVTSFIDPKQAINYATQKTGRRNFVTNPGYWELYKGSSPRSFTFTWSLVPTSSAEAELIRKVILTFKQYSSPQGSAEDSVMFRSPYIWTVTTSNQQIKKMLSPGDMVCTNLLVSYSDGTMALFKDGMPKTITITVSFDEVQVKTSSDYGGDTSDGIGNISSMLDSVKSAASGASSTSATGIGPTSSWASQISRVTNG